MHGELQVEAQSAKLYCRYLCLCFFFFFLSSYCYLLFHVANAFNCCCCCRCCSRCCYGYLFIYANAAVDNGDVAADADAAFAWEWEQREWREGKEIESELARTRHWRITKTVLTVCTVCLSSALYSSIKLTIFILFIWAQRKCSNLISPWPFPACLPARLLQIMNEFSTRFPNHEGTHSTQHTADSCENPKHLWILRTSRCWVQLPAMRLRATCKWFSSLNWFLPHELGCRRRQQQRRRQVMAAWHGPAEGVGYNLPQPVSKV